MYTRDWSRFGVPLGYTNAVDRWSSPVTLSEALRERNLLNENVDIQSAYTNAIRIAYDTNHTLTDEMLATVAWDASHSENDRHMQVDFSSFNAKRDQGKALVSFQLRVEGQDIALEGTGTGELSAFIDAINTYFQKAVGHSVDVSHHDPISETAQGGGDHIRDVDTFVEIALKINGDVVQGFGFHSDEVISGCRASLQALNRWYSAHYPPASNDVPQS